MNKFRIFMNNGSVYDTISYLKNTDFVDKVFKYDIYVIEIVSPRNKFNSVCIQTNHISSIEMIFDKGENKNVL